MAGATGRMIWRGMWLMVLVAGLLLIGYMVTMEGELGAISLAMVLAGLIGSAATWRRHRGA